MSTAPLPDAASARPQSRYSRIIRALLFVATFAALMGLFALGDLSGLVDLSPGQRSPRTVISNIDFDFQDTTATAAERDRAARINAAPVPERVARIGEDRLTSECCGNLVPRHRESRWECAR